MDPISDFLSIIKNGYQAQKEMVTIPYSKFKHQLADILMAEGFLAAIETINAKKKSQKALKLTLSYLGKDNIPAVTGLKRISSPSVHHYASLADLPRTLGSVGVTIVSTSTGLMSTRQALKNKIGGEIICKIW